MLVLSRKAGESLLIGDDVEIIVVQMRGDKVRLGIKAHRSLSVDRKEVRESKLRGDSPKIAEVAS